MQELSQAGYNSMFYPLAIRPALWEYARLSNDLSSIVAPWQACDVPRWHALFSTVTVQGRGAGSFSRLAPDRDMDQWT